MNDWYKKTDDSMWYKPLGYDPDSAWTDYSGMKDGNPNVNMPEKTVKRFTPARITGLVVLLCLLTGAVTYMRFGVPWEIAGKTTDESGYDPSLEVPADYPDDFNDFFKEYYTDTETVETDVRIEKSPEDIAFRLELEQAKGDLLTLSELYEKCSKSIVAITGYVDDVVGYNWGTGVVLSSDGLILTNTHVINGCDSAEVVTDDGETYLASLVGADSISDLAVLRIEAKGLLPAEFGESSDLMVGDDVAAIGNPLGDTFSGTLTNGIISAIDRDITYNGRNMTLIQTNTALNEGNSGGALFNMHGQVIGITNMKMMSTFSSIEGIGFAIPSSTVKGVVNSLAEFGEVRGRTSIGITVGQIPANIALHYEMPEGLYISAVSEGSDAAAQGILEGDVLTAVDGIPVRTTDDVVSLKDAKNVGDTMVFSIWRNGEELEFNVKLSDTNDIYR